MTLSIYHDEGPNSTVYNQYWRLYNAAKTSYSNIAYNPNVVEAYAYRYTQGQKLKDYHARVKAGELLPHTPFEQWSLECSTQGTCHVTSSTSGEHMIIEPYWAWFSLDSQLTKAEVEAYVPQEDLTYYAQAAAARIYSSGFDALTFVAELGPLRKMFEKTILRFEKLLKHPKTIKLDYKDISDLWLEGRYGWRPLLSEMQNLADALLAFDTTRKRYSERAGTLQRLDNYSETTPFSGSYFNGYYTTNDVIEISLRGSVTADIEPPQFQTNLLITAWEVIPLSFVVDWLVNVGQYLQAISFDVYNSQYTASTGYKITVTRQKELVPSQAGNWVIQDITRQATCIGQLTTRTPVSVPFVPKLKPRLDSWKVIDLLYLIAQRLK